MVMEVVSVKKVRRGRRKLQLKERVKSKSSGKNQLVRQSNYVQKIGWGGLPFPPRLNTKMHYVNSYRSTTSASSVNALYVYFNNPYGSTASGWSINGQPFGYDQLLAATGPYAKYTVTGAKIKLTFLNNSSSSPAAALVQVAGDDSFTTISTNQTMMQYGGQANSTYIPYIGVSGNSNAKKVWSRYIDVAKLVGMSRSALLGDDRYMGNYNGAPSLTPSLKVVSGAQASTASTDSDVTILLDIVFYMSLSYLQVDLPAS